MTTLLSQSFPRTLDGLADLLPAAAPGASFEAWLFEDAGARRAGEAALAARGITVRIRSAYKPLLCAFREEVDADALVGARIRYPRHPNAHPERFLLEAYPLKLLFADAELVMEPGAEGLDYEVELRFADGRTEERRVFAPNRLHPGTLGEDVLSSCGWLRVAGEAGAAIATDYEDIFATAVESVRSADPFERLTLRADIAAADEPLGWGDEVLSLREALHEDLYFAAREVRDASTGAASGRLAARPGQVIPDIRGSDGPARLEIATGTHAAEAGAETEGPAVTLASADRPPTIAQVRAELDALPGGRRFTAASRQGRVSQGYYKEGSGAPVLITAAQHANETSGVVGALRAAQVLAADPAAHFALVPVENIDGYELHQRLIRHNPRHMHHAARYTACGNDMSHRLEEPDDERRARLEGLGLSGAELHINLHGYPAHEWTRPLSGYLPQGFEMWTIPKGFFLIGSHQPGWEATARTLVERLTERLAENSALVAHNARQLDAVRAHTAGITFEVMNGIPFFINETTNYGTPVSLITEAPDETVYGEDFVLQQTAQMQAVLGAVAIWQELKTGIG
ncbi:peptidase M14 [Aurantimonas sp. MSK8Z-1]|uniref:peptidase M14 n=1 Tax=Mangrovibrevibacter kandeliae TaxID=2968473 RepID=UPI002117E5F5|nr:peptidase M14 [Aurantimonas sp. MSK8Z-1]MCW4113469.1 peptidase M14 [Aurantimonas sp. MSK8Z-1]